MITLKLTAPVRRVLLVNRRGSGTKNKKKNPPPVSLNAGKRSYQSLSLSIKKFKKIIKKIPFHRNIMHLCGSSARNIIRSAYTENNNRNGESVSCRIFGGGDGRSYRLVMYTGCSGVNGLPYNRRRTGPAAYTSPRQELLIDYRLKFSRARINNLIVDYYGIRNGLIRLRPGAGTILKTEKCGEKKKEQKSEYGWPYCRNERCRKYCIVRALNGTSKYISKTINCK